MSILKVLTDLCAMRQKNLKKKLSHTLFTTFSGKIFLKQRKETCLKTNCK